MKATTAVTLTMTSVNDNFTEHAPYVTIFLTSASISKLLAMQASVNITGALNSTFLASDFLSAQYIDEYTEEKIVDTFSRHAIMDENDIERLAMIVTDFVEDDSSLRMEPATIIVKQKGFRISAIPKHCGDDVRLFSEDFYIVNGLVIKTP